MFSASATLYADSSKNYNDNNSNNDKYSISENESDGSTNSDYWLGVRFFVISLFSYTNYNRCNFSYVLFVCAELVFICLNYFVFLF